ncbi:MAG: lipopolysaccharide assembly protein LapB [Pseudomonadota bacterium]|jgi:lipopolysaccharide biosynthesis regulator YciM
MDFEPLWLLLTLPAAFALGWLASRFDVKQWKREQQAAPQAYFKGLNLLLNEQQDKAIDAFIEAVQHDPASSDLHFALGNLFRRRGEYERAVRVHQHLLARADLPQAERDRAQHALAQDFLKAGLFDRAEQAYKALAGSAFATDARLALLTLHERARDWPAAIEVARGLESVGAGSFTQRIAHYWCELTLEADARGQVVDGDAALQRARDAAPQAVRPMVLAGQRLLKRGQVDAALAIWGPLLVLHPQAGAVIAPDFARAAAGTAHADTARQQLRNAYEAEPGAALLAALLSLEPDVAHRRTAWLEQLRKHPSLSAAVALLREQSAGPLTAAEQQALEAALQSAAKPLQRYRCAACGFEAQHYFWQCPGCHGWDSFPPRRLEDA